MKKTQLKGVIILLLTAFIWGSAFVAQSKGMEQVGTFTFNGLRTLLGGIVLLPVIFIRNGKAKKAQTSPAERKKTLKTTLICGSLLGVILCIASNCQQFAFHYTSAGKIAFITAFYMMFVPIIGLFIGKRISPVLWVCVVVGTVGLYLLCVNGGGLSAINRGDLYTLVSSVIFAVHIIVIDKFVSKVDPVALSCVQFLVSGGISFILMLGFESLSLEAIGNAIIPLLYSGILSCGVGYTLQIVGQKYTESTVASLLLCMESVFGVICAAILLGERMSVRETVGCGIMFIAIILSQLSDKITLSIKKRKN